MAELRQLPSQRKDDELMPILIIGSLFSIGLICVDIWYSDWPFLFSGLNVLLGILVIILHLLIVLVWVVVISNVYDPNYDKWRKWLLVLIVVAIASVAGARAASNEINMVQEDADKSKQEQTP